MEQLVNNVDMLSRRYVEPNARFLSEQEAARASAALVQPAFSQVVRAKNDPRLATQEYGLFSFTPSPNARPDQYGIYGVAKLRGNYGTEKGANKAADLIIRQVDSVNKVLVVRIGEMFPLTTETKWTEKFSSVDVQKQMDTIAEAKQREMEAEQESERKIILDREKKLLAENKEILDGTYAEDPLDHYIMLNVARAQLKWSKADVERKINEEIKPGIVKRAKAIAEMDEKYPDFRKQFLERYMAARTDACLTNEIPVDHEKVQQGFLKYLVEDIPD